MIHEIFMPLMGTLVQQKIVQWEKSPVDKVDKGDVVYVIQSDKADMDVESFNSGYLAAILVEAGGIVTYENPVVGLIAETEAEIPLAREQARSMQQKLVADEIVDRQNSASDKKALLSTIPSIQSNRQIDTATLNNFYVENKPKGLTMTGLLTKIVARTLAKYPLLNACLTKKGIKYNSQIDVNMPVFLSTGKTIFPTLFDVDRQNIRSISLMCLKLADRAIDNKLELEECDRGNITIINLGMLGVDRFDTALFESQSCTITFGANRNTLTTDNSGLFGVKKQMNVSLIGDRRLIDRAVGSAFLEDLALLIDNKALLSEL